MTQTSDALFKHAAAESLNRPLADRMRPKALDEVVGHEEIIGPQSALLTEVQQGHLPSIIFWGPPGVGKTTLAKLLAQEAQCEFQPISAVSSGVRDVKKIIEEAEKRKLYHGRQTVLFIDEIHRFNKAQQDALLHSVEDGTVTLIGATTENPSFEVNAPLLSRCRVIKLNSLSAQDLKQIVRRALSEDVLLKKYDIKVDALDQLILYGGGDARRTLNLLETAFYLADKAQDTIVISDALLKQAVQHSPVYYDKKGDYHYDIISAFIKSVRGSDPDAAVYWLAAMLEAGEDPTFIARRLVILASEDIGNAEPYALSLANAGFEAVKNIGMPEARIILAQVTTYLASVPKSNSAYRAIDEALEEIRTHGVAPVPLHLRNAPTKLMKELKYGADYKYPHNFKGHYVKQPYLPEKLKGRIFYQPGELGREAHLKEYLDRLRKRNKE